MKKYIALFMAVSLLAVCPCAWADYWNEGHSGTEADPYVIDTNADLEALRDRVNAGTESGDMYYKLTQNLNISQYTDWVPIGTENQPFTGHFDGNGKSIHVNINGWLELRNLFGTISTSGGYAVKNLTVDGSVKGRWTAGIANILNSASIEGCSFSGTLNAVEEGWIGDAPGAGGIVQYMAGGLIKNCNVNATISCIDDHYNLEDIGYAGGIVAKMSGGSIENCEVNGTTISASSGRRASAETPADEYRAYAGGIVGFANIANFDAIKNCTFSGTVASMRHSGGIVGHISGGNIRNNRVIATNNGSTSVSGRYIAGGIAGRIGETTVLESCDVSSLVTVVGENTAEGIGGIVGLMNASTVRDNESYATISGDISNMGGVVGKLDAATYTISNNRYSSAEHGIGNNAQGVPSEEGCIKVGPSIAITTTSLPDGVAESAYTATLATDSTSAVVWTLTNGTSLPTGLTLDRTAGTISGTPTTAGDYTFTVKASPTTGAPATKQFALRIQAKGTATITITTTSLPTGRVNASYNAVLSANTLNVTWSVSSGRLPTGLTLNSSTGAITGTPTAAGTSTFTVRAVSGSNSTTRQLSITINAGTTPTPTTITITTSSLPAGIRGTAYSTTLAASTSPVTWSVSSGTLPAGLSLSSAGVISGTPTSAGTSTFTVRAVSGSASAQKQLSITVSNPDPTPQTTLEITTSNLPDATAGQEYSATLTANISGVTWSLASGSLPAGLSLSSAGVISGTPTTSDTYTFTVRAVSGSASAQKQLSITVYDAAPSGGSGGGCESFMGIAGLAVLAFFLKKR